MHSIFSKKSFLLRAILFASFAVCFQQVSTFAQAQSRQLSLADVLVALRSKKADGGEKNKILTEAVRDRGITFSLTPEIEKELDSTGAAPELISAIRQKATVGDSTAPASETKTPAVPVATPTPQDYAFFRRRAQTFLNNGNLDSALADLNKAIELKPTESNAFFERGTTYLKQNKLDLAIADFTKAIELNSKDASAYYFRGMANETLRKIDDSLHDFTRAAELDASNEQAKAAVTRMTELQAKLKAQVIAEAPKTEPPPAPAVETKPVVEDPKSIALGALNTYAINLAKPVYTQMDQKMRYQGKVTVQVALDEKGKVISAKATDGPKALWATSEEAAKKSTFKPASYKSRPIASTGFIVYNFVGNP